MVFARAKSQFDQGALIWHGFALQPVISLKAPHGGLTVGVPRAGRFPGKIVLADQRFLDRLCAIRVDNLLAPYSR